MKWTVDLSDDRTEAVVTDHNSDQVATITNDGNGIAVPDDVLDVMFDAALAEYRNGNVEEALTIVAIMAGEQIEVIKQ